MICGEKCFEIFGISNFKKDKSENFESREEIQQNQNQVQLDQIKTKNDFLSNSDIGSESDSGLGSVRTSKKDDQTQSVLGTQSIRAAESTICTVTRADSMGTLAQDCISIEDEFNLLPMMEGGESLTDLVLFEFKKLDTIDILQLKHDFDQYDNLTKSRRSVQTRENRIPRNRTVPDLNMKGESVTKIHVTKAESRDQSGSRGREKKMRKKRKMTRKRVDSIKEDSSSTDSDRDSHQPIRSKQSQSYQKPAFATEHLPVPIQPRSIMKKTNPIPAPTPPATEAASAPPTTAPINELEEVPASTETLEEPIRQQSVGDLKRKFESV